MKIVDKAAGWINDEFGPWFDKQGEHTQRIIVGMAATVGLLIAFAVCVFVMWLVGVIPYIMVPIVAVGVAWLIGTVITHE